MQKTGDHKRFYARRGLVTRPVHLSPEEAEAIRQAAFHAHVSQQVWMREVLTGQRSVVPQRTPASVRCTTGYEPASPVKLTDTA